jgi:phytoene dehydrogenase-like protein
MAPEGKTAMVIQSAAFMDYGNKWKTEDGKRGDDYKAFKEKVADQLIANAERIIPGLKNKIVYKSIATPFTCERYTLNSKGASAGWTYNPVKAFNSGSAGFRGFMTPVKNLYLAGHWTMSPGGAPACFTSGKMVSSVIKWKKRFRLGK